MNVRFQATGNTLTMPSVVKGDEVWVASKGGYNVFALIETTDDANVTVGAYLRWENNA